MGSFNSLFHTGPQIELPVVPGDGYFGEHAIRPNIMKIDVEGYEHVVLGGLHETLQGLRPIVVLELTPFATGIDSPEELRRLWPEDEVLELKGVTHAEFYGGSLDSRAFGWVEGVDKSGRVVRASHPFEIWIAPSDR